MGNETFNGMTKSIKISKFWVPLGTGYRENFRSWVPFGTGEVYERNCCVKKNFLLSDYTTAQLLPFEKRIFTRR